MFGFFIRLDKLGKTICDIGLIIALIALIAFPLLDLFAGRARLLNFLTSPWVVTSFVTSLFYAALAAALSLTVGLLLAFSSRRYWSGKVLIWAVLAALLVLPDIASNTLSSTLLFFWQKTATPLSASMGNFVWATVLVFFVLSALMSDVGDDELEVAVFLGANSLAIILKFFLPRLKKMLWSLFFLLLSFNLALGYQFYFLWTPEQYLSTVNVNFTLPFSWFLRGSRELFWDFFPGAAVYLILLLLALVSGFIFIRNLNEQEVAVSDSKKTRVVFSKGSRKKLVTRKPPIKRRKKN